MVSAAFIVVNLVWIYWAGRIASDHGLRPGWYRLLGFLLGPIGVVLSVWLVRNQLRRDHAASGSKLPVRSLPGFAAPVVVCLLVLAPITFFWARAVQERRISDQSSSVPQVTLPPTLGGGAVPSGLGRPTGVAVDRAGDVYVADSADGAIVEVPHTGAPVVFASGIQQPNGLALDPSGDLLVTDITGVWKLPTSGTGEPTRVAVAGAPVATQSLAVDRSGNLSPAAPIVPDSSK